MVHNETMPARDLPDNSDKPAISVRHSDLKRSDDSAYRSVCPACKVGVLPVRRDPITFAILTGDNCFGCGQSFIYEDVGSIGS